jgi:hypothetical protein
MNNYHESGGDNLAEAVKSLAQACPSLRLVSFSNRILALYGTFASFSKPMDDLDKPSYDDGKHIRFWLPAEEIKAESSQF